MAIPNFRPPRAPASLSFGFGALRAGAASLLVALAPIPGRAQTCAGSGAPTRVTITLDGNDSDWVPVFTNALQVTRDGQWTSPCTNSTDRDCQNRLISGRDLAKFAWTYDATNLYLYYSSGFGDTTNPDTFYFYADTNLNQRMETGEKVLQIVFFSSSNNISGTLFDYRAAAGAAGDPMVNAAGFADGYTLPGTLTGGTVLYSDRPWSFASVNGFEASLPWSALGVPAGSGAYFHVSSASTGNPGQVPAVIDDNLGGPDGGLGSFAFRTAALAPDRASAVGPGNPTVVEYLHTLTNTGTLSDQYDFIATSSQSLRLDLFEAATGKLMATSLTGNGIWNSIQPGYDGNGDGRPDSPPLAPGASYAVKVRITAPAGITNVRDVTVLTALSRAAACARPLATDTTAIGALTLTASPQAKSAVPGGTADYPLSLANHAFPDTFNLTVAGTAGFRYDLYADAGCTGAAGALMASDLNGNGVYTDPGDLIAAGYDSDNNRQPDFGPQGNSVIRCFVVRVTGGPAAGIVDTAGVTARGAANNAVAAATLATTVRNRLTLTPSYTTAAGTNKFSGPGAPVYYGHLLVNSWSAADSVTLSAVSSLGYPVRLWTDPNGDGNPADGALIGGPLSLGPSGGALNLVVEVQIPAGVAAGTVDTTTVTATSGLSPATTASASDQVRVGMIAAFGDALRSIAQSAFTRCQTLYARGSDLTPNTRGTYAIVYRNPANAAVRTAPVATDGNGEALDQYAFAAADPPGTWTIQLLSGATIVGSITVTLEPAGAPPTVAPLTFNQASYPLTGGNLSLAAQFNNPSATASYYATAHDFVVLNPGATQYLTAAGTFAPYGASQVTRSTAPWTQGPAGASSETLTVAGVAFPGPGVYGATVVWRGSCGGVIATASASFPVGSALASFSDPARTVAASAFPPGSTVYLRGNYLMPSAAYTVVYYNPSGAIALTQAATADGSGRVIPSATAAALATLGNWHAAVYPAGAAIPAAYTATDPALAAQAAFSLVNASPAVSGPIYPTDPAISGTSTAPPGTVITVYRNGVPIGTTTVQAGGTWTLGGVSGLAGNDRITATAGSGGALSPVSPAQIVAAQPGLLRNAALGTLAPTVAQKGAIFPRAGDPALARGDLVVALFAPAAAYPQQSSDYTDTATPIVFFQLEANPGNTLRVSKETVSGKLVITY